MPIQIREIVTPFIDRNGNHITVRVTTRSDSTVVSDNGYILDTLRTNGYQVDVKTFEDILRRFHVKMREGQLETTTSDQDFTQGLHMVIQAVLAYDACFYLLEQGYYGRTTRCPRCECAAGTVDWHFSGDTQN